MTLVERLRRLGAAIQNTDRTHCEFCFGISGATEFEAADALDAKDKEIERLKNETAMWRRRWEAGDGDYGFE